MSRYSLDSLEAEARTPDDTEDAGVVWIERVLETVSSSIVNREIPGAADSAAETLQVVGKSGTDDKPMKGENRNALIAQTEPRPQPQPSPQVIRSRKSPADLSSPKRYPTPRRSSSILELEESSGTDSNIPKLKNDKKLNSVLPPKMIEAKTKPKTYLEQYHRRVGVPARMGIYSPEGSALSIFGDSSYEQISDLESRPSISTPRDDQSELSFYRRLINQPRTTRSWDVNERCTVGENLRSISEYGLTTNREKRRLSYRPYSIGDYECLTVPRADRSLGPDPVEVREKWEKLMLRTQYGELASSRNRQNVARRCELRKCKRTNVQKPSGGFPLTEDIGAGLVPESKNSSVELQPDEKSSEIRTTTGLKRAPRNLRSKRISRAEPPRGSQSSTNLKTRGRSSRTSLIQSLERGIGDSNLEDLQRRHQNEKRVMEILINRTLLR